MLLLFDIGGTNTRIALGQGDKILENKKMFPTPKTFEEGMEVFAAQAKDLLGAQLPQLVVGGIAGRLLGGGSGIAEAPNLQGWKNKPFKHILEQAFSCPVILENDAALGGLGEALYGAGRGQNIVAFLTVSTGVGGSVIINGKICPNAQGFEPGKQIVDFNSGRSLEEAISGSSLQAKHNVLHAEEIKDAKVWEEAARYLAVALNNTITYWSPNIIVVGGSLMLGEQGINLERVKEYLGQIAQISQLPPVVTGELGDSRGLYGALALSKA